jgi:hypothetical protein
MNKLITVLVIVASFGLVTILWMLRKNEQDRFERLEE